MVFFLCGALITEAHLAAISDAGGHKGAQRHLLTEDEEHTNSNETELQRE